MATTGAPNQKYNAEDEPDLVNGAYAGHTHDVDGILFERNSFNVTNLVDMKSNTRYPVDSEVSNKIIVAQINNGHIGFCRLLGILRVPMNLEPSNSIDLSSIGFTVESYKEVDFPQGGCAEVRAINSVSSVLNTYVGMYVNASTTISSLNQGILLFVPGLVVTEDVKALIIIFC